MITTVEIKVDYNGKVTIEETSKLPVIQVEDLLVSGIERTLHTLHPGAHPDEPIRLLHAALNRAGLGAPAGGGQ